MKAKVLLCLFVLMFLGCAYHCAFYWWLSATPAYSESPERIRFFFWLMFAGAIVGAVGTLVMAAWVLTDDHRDKP